MFNLDRVINNSSKHLPEQNQKKSEESFKKVEQLIERAAATTVNKEIITEAGELCISIIHENPAFINAYLTLAYIFAMYEDFENAIKILNSAFEKEPGNQYLNNMLADYNQKYRDYSSTKTQPEEKQKNETFIRKQTSPLSNPGHAKKSGFKNLLSNEKKRDK